jgi:hypothetical protein
MDARIPEVRVPIQSETSSVSAPFNVRASGLKGVALEFTLPIPTPDLTRLIAVAGIRVGEADAPKFDLTWSIVDDSGREVASGNGDAGARGVIEEGTGGFGGGQIVKVSLLFGDCVLNSEENYTLEAVIGSQLKSMFGENVALVVVARPNWDPARGFGYH